MIVRLLVRPHLWCGDRRLPPGAGGQYFGWGLRHPTGWEAKRDPNPAHRWVDRGGPGKHRRGGRGEARVTAVHWSVRAPSRSPLPWFVLRFTMAPASCPQVAAWLNFIAISTHTRTHRHNIGCVCVYCVFVCVYCVCVCVCVCVLCVCCVCVCVYVS